MKSMKVKKWKAIAVNGKEVEENIINVLTVIIQTSIKDIGKGIDIFRFFNRISTAFNNAEKTGILEIEDGDYIRLSEIIRKNIPANLAFSKDIYSSVEEFLKL